MFSGGGKTSAGLDIGSQAIKLVSVQRQGAKAVIKAFAQEPTPSKLVDGGIVADPMAIGQVVRNLVERCNLKGAKVISAVAGQQAYTRLLTLPNMPMDELRHAALYQSSSFLPLSIDEVAVDVFPVRHFEDEEGKKLEIFFVAARKVQVENLQQACQIGGLKLTRVEIEPLALYQLYRQQIASEPVVAVLNIGAQRTYLAVFRQSIMVFLRTIAFGCSAFFQQIQQYLGRAGGLESIDLNDPAFQNLVADLLGEVGRSLDYYQLQHKEDNVGRIIICGGGSRIPGIEGYLSNSLNRPVLIGGLGEEMELPGELGETEQRALFHDFPVAVGLAVRGVF